MRKRRILFGGAMIVAIIAVAILGWLAVWGPEVRFDPELWQRPYSWPSWIEIPIGGDNLRARMVRDVLSGRLRLGMSREAVNEILGRDDAGGNGIAIYRLMPIPTVAQKVVAFVRWRTTDPHLVLEFNGRHRSSAGNYPDEHLVRIQVGHDW